MERLKFLETMTVNEFKTGADSDKFVNGEVTVPVISQVCSPDTGDMFYMLHQKGEGGAMTVATL